MNTQRIKIPIFDFDLIVVRVEGKDDKDKMESVFREIKITDEYRDMVLGCIERGYYDGGETFRNMDIKKILVIFYPFKSESKRRNIIAHEMRHVVDRIMEHCFIEDNETPAYLQGWIAEKIY